MAPGTRAVGAGTEREPARLRPVGSRLQTIATGRG